MTLLRGCVEMNKYWVLEREELKWSQSIFCFFAS
jgi:hypothetical protein